MCFKSYILPQYICTYPTCTSVLPAAHAPSSRHSSLPSLTCTCLAHTQTPLLLLTHTHTHSYVPISLLPSSTPTPTPLLSRLLIHPHLLLPRGTIQVWCTESAWRAAEHVLEEARKSCALRSAAIAAASQVTPRGSGNLGAVGGAHAPAGALHTPAADTAPRSTATASDSSSTNAAAWMPPAVAAIGLGVQRLKGLQGEVSLVQCRFVDEVM